MTETATEAQGGIIRRARPAEAAAISELAFRSKAHWGYDAEFLELSREDLTTSPVEVANMPIYVAECDGNIAGFYSLAPEQDGNVVLDDLFVDPRCIGRGLGRRLWEHAVATAQAMGFAAMVFQSDPHAEGFYTAMGAVRAGESESTVTPGRMLPLMRYEL